jgi:predicted phosphoribosyltransferase
VLAEKLLQYRRRPEVVVLALPRGGVPVGYEVARILQAPLDVFVVRKLGVPGHEELAMGAIASGGARVLNEEVVRFLEIPSSVLAAVTAEESREVERREQLYRGQRPFPELQSRTVILVDDGLATGSTMRAGVAALRKHRPARIVVAVPVGASSTCEALRHEADECVCVHTPDRFDAVGFWYDDFTQTTDDEVRALLGRASPSTRPTVENVDARGSAGIRTDERASRK